MNGPTDVALHHTIRTDPRISTTVNSQVLAIYTGVALTIICDLIVFLTAGPEIGGAVVGAEVIGACLGYGGYRFYHYRKNQIDQQIAQEVGETILESVAADEITMKSADHIDQEEVERAKREELLAKLIPVLKEEGLY